MSEEAQFGFLRTASEAEVLELPAGPLQLFASADVTEGALAVWRDTVAPQSGLPLHIHYDAHEAFYVLEGEFEFRLSKRLVRGPTGSFAFIPRGVPHSYKNVGTSNGRLLGLVIPAGLEDFYRAQTRVDSSEMTAEIYKALGAKFDFICVSADETV